MKRITTVFIILVMIFSTFAVTSNAASTTGGYVKVKNATYQKYKKAYKENVKLKKQIKQQKNTIKALQTKLSNSNTDLEDAESMNSWLWMNIKSMGITYNSKNWTIPASYPSSFIINGSTYTVTVTKEEAE